MTSGTVPTARISGAYTGITQTGTLTSFASTGIDDNATSTAITIDSSNDIDIGATVSGIAATSPQVTISSTGEQLLLQGTTNGTGQSVDILFEQKLTNDNTRNGGKISSVATGSYTAGDGGTYDSALVFYSGVDGVNTERVRMDGDGIKFNGDTAAANGLNDYEEGDWTPGLGSYGTTPTINNSHYIKIGKLVMASTRIVLANISDASAFRITGLPFTCKNTTNDVFGGTIHYTTSTVTRINLLVERNGTDTYLYNNDGSTMSYNTFGIDKQIRLTLIYQTD